MPFGFDTGIPPPPTKYSYTNIRFEHLGIDDGSDNDSDDGGKWMFSSAVESSPVKNENEATSEDLNQKNTYEVKPRFSHQDWLEKIEEKYFDERDDLVRTCLQTALMNVDEPYTFTLHVILCGFFDSYSKRVPIQYYALDELSLWLDLKRQNGETVPHPFDSQKCQAGEFICRCGYNYLDKVTKLFRLDEGDNSMIAKYIKLDHLKSKKLKETVTIISTLKLQHCFTAADVMLPLLVNDQMQVLESYIENDKKLQHDYVSYLNELCSMEEEEIIDMVSEKGFQIKDISKLQHKTIRKIAEKAVRNYKLDANNYHQIFEAKNLNSLDYLVKMRQKEKSLANPNSSYQEKWDNLLETAVIDKKWLQVHLIQKFCDTQDLHAAVTWSIKLRVYPEDLPLPVAEILQNYAVGYELEIPPQEKEELDNVDKQEYEEELEEDEEEEEEEDTILEYTGINASGTEPTAEPEDWESEIDAEGPRPVFSYAHGFIEDESRLKEGFYQLHISEENIHLIDSIVQLKTLSVVLFSDPHIMIAFDAEWKSMFSKAGEKPRISILQLAIQDRVFILDLFKMYVEHGADSVLDEFFFKFFTSNNVKIGYGITGDLKILIEMFSNMKGYILDSRNLVDLCDVSRKIIGNPSVQSHLPEQVGPVEKGLSGLVTITLGKRLDKTYQVSDWERRPLNTQQLYYAALDAYCLLEVYAFLQNIVEESANLKVNLNERVQLKWLKPNRNNNQRKDKYEKKYHKEKVPINNKPVFKGLPRPSTSLKVICDTMLQGLGRQLRSCGVDTLIMETHQDQSTTIQISRRENRVVLTQGRPYFQLRGFLSEGMCMLVPDGKLKEQVKMVFTRYNIYLTREDLLSRCMICNSKEFTVVPADEMETTFNLKYEIGDAEMPDTQKTKSGVINLSNFSLLNGTEIQLDFFLSIRVGNTRDKGGLSAFFQKVKVFNVCSGCGKIYWDGSHYEDVNENFKDLIAVTTQYKYRGVKPR